MKTDQQNPKLWASGFKYISLELIVNKNSETYILFSVYFGPSRVS
jgi:hypothetical protein